MHGQRSSETKKEKKNSIFHEGFLSQTCGTDTVPLFPNRPGRSVWQNRLVRSGRTDWFGSSVSWKFGHPEIRTDRSSKFIKTDEFDFG